VPNRYKVVDPQTGKEIRLGKWLSDQRTLKKRNSMLPERQAKLQKLVDEKKLDWALDLNHNHSDSVTWKGKADLPFEDMAQILESQIVKLGSQQNKSKRYSGLKSGKVKHDHVDHATPDGLGVELKPTLIVTHPDDPNRRIRVGKWFYRQYNHFQNQRLPEEHKAIFQRLLDRFPRLILSSAGLAGGSLGGQEAEHNLIARYDVCDAMAPAETAAVVSGSLGKTAVSRERPDGAGEEEVVTVQVRGASDTSLAQGHPPVDALSWTPLENIKDEHSVQEQLGAYVTKPTDSTVWATSLPTTSSQSAEELRREGEVVPSEGSHTTPVSHWSSHGSVGADPSPSAGLPLRKRKRLEVPGVDGVSLCQDGVDFLPLPQQYNRVTQGPRVELVDGEGELNQETRPQRRHRQLMDVDQEELV